MELELIDRALHFWLVVSAMFAPVLILLAYLSTSEAKIWKSAKVVWASVGVITVSLIVAATLVGNAGTDEMNERFNNQLAEKYDSTSSRSFSDMEDELATSGEASTTLTRDDVETTVFLKVIKDGKRNFDTVKLALTVFDEGSLYPESK